MLSFFLMFIGTIVIIIIGIAIVMLFYYCCYKRDYATVVIPYTDTDNVIQDSYEQI